MRGIDDKQASMFSVVSPERRVPADHPLPRIKALADEVLRGLSSPFDVMYSKVGRPSIPPERLLKSQILIALYSVRSDRQFCEQLDYNLIFRWFLDMNADEATFDASSFSRNRDRLLDHDVPGKFFAAVVAQAWAAHLISADFCSGCVTCRQPCRVASCRVSCVIAWQIGHDRSSYQVGHSL